MSKSIFFVLVIFSVIAVAVADVFLKKATVVGQLGATLKSPWFWAALVLYLFQIFFHVCLRTRLAAQYRRYFSNYFIYHCGSRGRDTLVSGNAIWSANCRYGSWFKWCHFNDDGQIRMSYLKRFGNGSHPQLIHGCISCFLLL
jgi:hypothetical protein